MKAKKVYDADYRRFPLRKERRGHQFFMKVESRKILRVQLSTSDLATGESRRSKSKVKVILQVYHLIFILKKHNDVLAIFGT